jgi:DNA-binding beta-propeller fold protein YncE
MARSKSVRAVLVVIVLISVAAVSHHVARGQAGNAGPDIPALPLKSVEWPLAPTSVAGFPAPWNFIQVSGIAISSKGTVLVLHRGAHPILEFTPEGKLLRSWGDGLFSEGKVAGIPKANWAPTRSRYSAVYGAAGCASCGAHSVRVDRQGSIWVVDATGHVIYKLNQDGKEVMRLGTKGTAGTGRDTFNLPTDIAFASNGDMFVTDGYGSARVVKFTREGKYVLEWGTRGTGPGEFMLPHNLVIDPQDKVYVTDRDNQRIQVFDVNGKFLSEWKETGGVSGLALTGDGRIVTGSVVRDLTGKPLGRLADAAAAHGAAVDAAGNIYLAQLSGVVQKFTK